jgi:hypothetical protein
MEIYIVRIYRRDRQDHGMIAGQVEVVGSGETRIFADIGGLEKILGAGDGGDEGDERRH